MSTLCPICGQRNDSSGHICWAYHPHVTATSLGTNPISSMTITTDNSAVIRALEKRVAELEAVAGAAEKYVNRAGIGSAADELVVMLDALRAAGYLNA